MIKFYKIFFLIIFVILTSCSSENKKISIIKEDDLELQMIDAYKEAYAELEKGDVIYAARKLNIKDIYSIGGAQAIGSLTYIQKVDKIVGPGNIYVATAKKEVIGDVKVAKINNVPVSSDSEGKNILFKLSSKEEVVILGEKGDFYNIMASEGEGWVKKILLK